MEFTTDRIFEALKRTLRVVEDEQRRAQLEGFVDATKASLEQSIFDLLSQFAESVNGEVGAHYQVSLSYKPGGLVLEVRPRGPGEAAEGEAWSMAEGEVEKITLRIPAELKELATEAAARAGLSVNAWFVRMLARALRSTEAGEPPSDERRRHGRHGGFGRRVTGWVGPEE
jgi:hypothetical protein